MFIGHDGERYLLQTGTIGHLLFAPFPVNFVIRWLTMLPLATFIAIICHRSDTDLVLGGAVGGGVLVATIGVLAPYIEMIGFGSARTTGVLL